MRAVVGHWKRYATLPAAFGLVTYAEFDRSASSADGPARRPLSGGDVTLTAMSDPSDLRRLGTAITLYLDDWADPDRETLVYVDALDPFVEANGVESVFQFLHLLVGTVDQFDADVVVRLDPSTTDDRTINTYRTLFDEVIDTTRVFDADELHALLRNDRRRFVLRALLDTSPMGLERLAANLACREHDTDAPTEEQRDRAYTALASVHVPRLVEGGLVAFDRSAKRVRLADGDWSAGLIKRYLSADDDRYRPS